MNRHQATAGRRRGLALCAALALLSLAFSAAATVPDGEGTYDQLIRLFQEFHAWKTAQTSGVADYSPSAIERRREELARMQARMRDMGVKRWSVAEQVDYLTVRAELDQQDFILSVTRPWARDPVFYIAPLLDIAFTELPAEGDELSELQNRLRAIPTILEAARANLVDVAADYAGLAIRSLTQSDGVENGYPYVSVAPEGVKVSLYNRPGKGLIAVIANTGPDKCSAEIAFNRKALGQKSLLSAIDVLTDKTIPLSGDCLEVPLESLGFVIVRLTPVRKIARVGGQSARNDPGE